MMQGSSPLIMNSAYLHTKTAQSWTGYNENKKNRVKEILDNMSIFRELTYNSSASF